MIEEPYRWVEAIANRREYIEHELASGSPTVGLTYPGGQLLLTFGRDRRKIFEIYDHIAMGGIGHPGDLERLRMMAIELASAEGFSRSAADVSLRRMVSYSFSPALKQAFEQIYGAPYLTRILFAELGPVPDADLFIRLDYDGTITASSLGFGKRHDRFGVIAGNRAATEAMENFLAGIQADSLELALGAAVKAWGIGYYVAAEEERDPPDDAVLADFLKGQLAHFTVEAAVLERNAKSRVAYATVPEKKLEGVLSRFQ